MSSNEPITADQDKNRLLSGLPPAETRRWSSRRKAAIVIAIRAGVLNRQEAYERYTLSPEELASRLGGRARSKRHPGPARHAPTDLPRRSPPKTLKGHFPGSGGNIREKIASGQRVKPKKRSISDT